MRSGKLSHLLTIQRATTAISAAGTPEETWADLADLRAERMEQSAEEFIRNYGAAEETVIVFRTRFIPGVTNADRVRFGGVILNLKQVVILGRNRGLELRCVRLD